MQAPRSHRRAGKTIEVRLVREAMNDEAINALAKFKITQRLDGLFFAVDLLQQLLQRLGVVLAVDRIVGIDCLSDLEP